MQILRGKWNRAGALQPHLFLSMLLFYKVVGVIYNVQIILGLECKANVELFFQERNWMQHCRCCCTKQSQSEAPDEDILLYYIGITGKGLMSPNILTKPEVIAKCVLDWSCCFHSTFCFLLAKCRVCEISIITMGNKSWWTTWQLVWVGENGHIWFGVISWQEAECTASIA